MTPPAPDYALDARDTPADYRGLIRALDDRRPVRVRTPDGVWREVWGVSRATGDVVVAGWPHNVFLEDATAPRIRVEYHDGSVSPVWVG